MNLESKLLTVVRALLWMCIALFLLLVLCSCGTMTAVRTPTAGVPSGSSQLYEVARSTNWLATFSIIGIGLSAFAFLNGSSKGIHALAACFIVLSLTLMIAEFAWWLALIALIGATSLMGYTILVKHRAFREVVCGCENLKTTLRSRGEGLIFKNIMTEAQKSKATKELVAKERETM